MDYYEEFGLSRTASVEEIRQAYRQLARLIHPDQQPDDHLRRLAEMQMKRLNLILELLTDPARRREYDLSLAPPAPLICAPPPPRRPDPLEWMRRVHPRVWVWVVASLVGAIAIGVFFGHYAVSGPAVAARTAAAPSPPAAEPPPDDRPQPAAPPAPRPAPKTHVAAALADQPSTLPPPEAPVPAPLPEPEVTPFVTPGRAPLLPVPSLPKPAADTPTKPGFAGNWIYSPSPGEPKTAGLYAPEYIEMKIAEEPGRLWGTYRARYLVTDRAISPAVVFHFEGRAATPLVTLRWNGSGGAHGRVTLKLVSDDLLQVSWVANQLSRELGLISGVATLARRHDP